MNRREALSAVSVLLGGTIIGAEAFLTGCSKPSPKGGVLLTGEQMSFLDEVGEVIIPVTESSGGAKAARIGEFMDIIVKDCYSNEEQKIFLDGITLLNDRSKQEFENGFLALTADQKHDLLLKLEGEAWRYQETKKPEDPPVHYYTMIKQLTVWGYFSSEIGSTQALRHVAVPGRFDACIPLEPGQKAWSS